jgi:hypothetical protein
MAKWQNDTILDQALNYIKSNANKLTVCSAQPTTYAEAVNVAASSGYMLADIVISSADFTGPANGDTSGRKVTVNQQADVLIDATGSATHIALVDTGSSGTLLYVTTCTSQSLTQGNNVTIPAWDVELYDAA